MEGLAVLRGETRKQAAGSGSGNITEVEGPNGKRSHAMKA